MSRQKLVIIGLIALIFIGFSIYFLLSASAWIEQQRTFYAARDRIEDATLRALDTPPPIVKNPSAWHEAVDQTFRAIANIMNSPTMLDKQRILQFEQDLKAELSGPIDMNTILWIWDHLEVLSPFAKDYVERYKPRMQKHLDNAITGERIEQ